MSHIERLSRDARVRLVVIMIALLAIAGCNSQPVRTGSGNRAPAATFVVPPDLLLDVQIAIFDAGIDLLDPKTTTTTPGVRRAEAHYIPPRLAEQLAHTGHWGSITVVPETGRASDVEVQGKIIESDGETLEVEVSVADARGKHWFTRQIR